MTEFRSALTKRLRTTREWRELSQEDLSQLAGLPRTAVSHFETGHRVPSVGNLLKLANTLGITLDYLLGRRAVPAIAGELVARVLSDLVILPRADQELAVSFVSMLRRRAKRNA